MSSKGQVFALPSDDEIPRAEHSQTLPRVVAVCQRQQERRVLREERVAQLKDERAILKGEKPRPQMKPSTLNKDTPEGDGPNRGPPRRDPQAPTASNRKSGRSPRRTSGSRSRFRRGRSLKAMKTTAGRACGYGSTTRGLGGRGIKRRTEKRCWASYRARSAGVIATRR